jgi:methyl-accepting chemotaxis protein
MLKRFRFRRGGGRRLNLFGNMKLRPKLLGSFLIVALFTGILGFFALRTYTDVDREVTQLGEDVVPGAISMLDLEATFGSLFKELEEYLTLGEEEALADVSEYILAIQKTTTENTESEAAIGEEEYLAAYELESRAAYILGLAQRVVDTSQTMADLQTDSEGIRAEMYREAVELGEIIEERINMHASEFDDTQAGGILTSETGDPVDEAFRQLTEDVVPTWVSLLETQAALGRLITEVEEAYESGDVTILAENVYKYMERIRGSTTELTALAPELGEEEAAAAADIEMRAADIIVLAQEYMNEIFPLMSKRAEHMDLKLEMYSEAKALGEILDLQIGEHMDELDASTAAVNRAQAVGQQTIWLVAAIALAVALVLGFGVTRSILRPVSLITNTYSEVGMGNFDARAEVVTGDELGDMSIALNSMLDNTLGLIQTRQERDAMQASIQKLLREVSGVAEGDLTVEAEVTADMTGAIADSFNLMIGQLRNIITGVQEATLHVSSSANEIRTTTEHLSQGSESQAMQIADTSSEIEEMAVSIAQVSENATVSATVGEQSLTNAREGTLAVQNTMEGMNRIRDQVQETAKRIKRLGESSQEIGEIVQLIGDIADRTSILALNASIQAAMAGEAGQGFAVVAEEVERLAERSTQATKQIDTLIRTIQNETNEAVAAMEATTNEVVAGSKLAEEAGQALSEIETVSARLAELSQSISLASKQQARGSEVLAKSMSEIAEVTQQTASGTKQAAVSISSLASLADELRESVSAFKLPSGNGRETV